MTIVAATRAYEAWAGRRIDLVAAHLRLKHRAMASAAFPFLRATFYRWAALWREACPELAAAPVLLAVGDLHIENFGTWRDAEGRLVWGINDFDEAFPMPYTIDLVRLATSALVAGRGRALSITPEAACAAILDGYRQAMLAGKGHGFVLEEEHPLLRAMALGAERDPVRFWAKLTGFPTVTPPRGVRRLLARELPDGAAKPRVVARVAGLGSLGRPRYVAITPCDGGLVAREAKAMLPSAYGWAMDLKNKRFHLETIIARAIRPHDPFFKARKGWVLRRLGPHCSRIEISDFPRLRDEERILHAMGRETANVHLGSGGGALDAVRRDLRRRRGAWLHEAAAVMASATLADWRDWRRHAGA